MRNSRDTSLSVTGAKRSQDLSDEPQDERNRDHPLEDSISTSRPKSLIGNGMWNMVFVIWRVGVAFCLIPFVLSRVGPDHYGLSVLVMSISGMMGLMNMGLGEATLRFVAHHYGRNDLSGINKVMGATLSLYIALGCLGGASLFLGAGAIARFLSLTDAMRPLAIDLLRLAAFSFGVSVIGGAYASVPQSLQRYDIKTKIGVCESGCYATGAVLVLIMGGGSTSFSF